MRVIQPHANANQSNRTTTAGIRLSTKLGVAFWRYRGACLLQSSLGKVVEFQLDKGLANPVNAIQSAEAFGQLVQQRR